MLGQPSTPQGSGAQTPSRPSSTHWPDAPNICAQKWGWVITLDPPFIGIGDVYISNTSLTRAVTLRLFLVIKDKDGKVTKLEGDGRGPMLRFMGRDDISTKFAQQRGLMPPKYILSPVSPHYAAR